MKKVTVLIEYDDFWKGTTIDVDSECDEYYYGIISETGGSYKGKLKKKYCVEVPEGMSWMEKYIWFDDQIVIRKRELRIENLLNGLET